MKRMKKVLLAVPVVLALSAGAVMLTSCGDKEMKFNASSDLKANVEHVIDDIIHDAYNLPNQSNSQQIFTVAELGEHIQKEVNYYVTVGTLSNCKEVSSIDLGGVEYSKDDTVKVSIGNSNFVDDVVYCYNDGALKVAAPVLAFETVGQSNIKINDKVFSLGIASESDEFDFSNVSFYSENSKNTVSEKDAEGVYNVNLKSATEALGFYYEGATADDVVLTRKHINGALNGYGLTKTEAVDGNPLALYVSNYTSDINDVNDKFNNAKWDYEAYVRGKGVATAKFNVEVSKQKYEANANTQMDADAAVQSVVANAYNNTALGTDVKYTVDELNAKLGQDKAIGNYYVEVGSLSNFEDVESIEIGGVSFAKDQTASLSIGNSNQIRDVVFKFEKGKLMVAAPILAFEGAVNNSLKVNGREFALNMDANSETIDFAKVEFLNENTKNEIKQNDGVYEVTLKSATDALGFSYEGAQKDDVVLTKKTLNGNVNSYGLTVVENADGYPFSLYLSNYTTSLGSVKDQYRNATWNYNVYILGKGLASAEIKSSVARDIDNLSDLQTALSASGKDGVLMLTRDITISENVVGGGLNVARKVVLDLNGHKINAFAGEDVSMFENVMSVFILREGADLTITGNGIVDGIAGDVYGFTLTDGAKLLIESGTIKGAASAVYVIKGEAEIRGGYFDATPATGMSDSRYTLNLLDRNGQNGSARIVVYGGTFANNFNPADNLAENPKVNFVADGYKVTEEGGVYTVVKDDINNIY